MRNIVVAGIGGVGGYFGGLLAQHYHGSDIHINFYCRGSHLEAIRTSGLTILDRGLTLSTYPYHVSGKANTLEPADLIFFCCKQYHLHSMMEQLRPIIQKHTILVPLLNGVEACEDLATAFPQNELVKACCFIIAYLKEPGTVYNQGPTQRITIGADAALSETHLTIQSLCLNAGIDITLSDNISETIWSKYLYISPLATLTSYHNLTVGEVFSQHRDTLDLLMSELQTLATLKGIPLRKDVIDQTVNKIAATPFTTTTSMQRDLSQRKPCELETLCGYVVRESRKYSLDAPTYTKYYQELSQLAASIT